MVSFTGVKTDSFANDGWVDNHSAVVTVEWMITSGYHMSGGRKMVARVPCTPETLKKIRDFTYGLNLNYDEAINFILSELSETGEAEMLAGFRLREKAQAWKAAQEKVKQEK